MTYEKEQRLKKIIIVLTVLLVLSVAALAGVLWLSCSSRTASNSVPNNSIVAEQETVAAEKAVKIKTRGTAMHMAANSAEETTLELYRSKPDDNQPFAVNNMFPGDAIKKNYCVRVSHKGAVLVHFRANVRPGYEKLAEVLKIKVIIDGEERYNGLMCDMPDSLKHTTPSTTKAGNTDLNYQLTAYLETSVGNDYQNQDLVADFVWWVEVDETSGDGNGSGDDNDSGNDADSGDDSGSGDDNDSGENHGSGGSHGAGIGPDDENVTVVPGQLVDLPRTGDITWTLLAIVLVSGLMFLLMLLFEKRSKEEHDEP